jgi:hypothetical protein
MELRAASGRVGAIGNRCREVKQKEMIMSRFLAIPDLFFGRERRRNRNDRGRGRNHRNNHHRRNGRRN